MSTSHVRFPLPLLVIVLFPDLVLCPHNGSWNEIETETEIAASAP